MGCNVTALEPDEVLVVVNQYAGENKQLVDLKYFSKKEKGCINSGTTHLNPTHPAGPIWKNSWTA